MRKIISWDLETHLIRPNNPCPRIVCGIHQINNEPGQILLRDAALDALEGFLKNPMCILVGTYVVFDLSCATAERPELLPLIDEAYQQGRIWDIATAQKIRDLADGAFDEQRGTKYSLAHLAKYVLQISLGGKLALKSTEDVSEVSIQGRGDNTQWRLRFALLDDVPIDLWPEAAVDYCLADVSVPSKIYQHQLPFFNNYPQLERERQATGLRAWYLRLAGVHGAAVHPKHARRLVDSVAQSHAEHQKFLLDKGLARWQGKGTKRKLVKDTKRVQALVARAYGGNLCGTCSGFWKATSKQPLCPECSGRSIVQLEGVPLTQSGKVSTDDATLKGSGDAVLKQLRADSAQEKLWTTYSPILQVGIDYGRIHPRWNELVSTGRTSCSEPNLQNQPRKGGVRECFVPRKGHLLCSNDYSTLELFTLGQTIKWLLGESHLLELLNAGVDVHTYTAAKITNGDYEELLARKKRGDPKAKEWRALGKASNFSLPGGLGTHAFTTHARDVYDLKFCHLFDKGETCGRIKKIHEYSGAACCADCYDIAHVLRRAWFDTFPEVEGYHNHIKTQLDGPYAQLMVPGPATKGPGLIRSYCGFTNGANLGFQGPAARLATDAFVRVGQKMYLDRDSVLYGSRNIAFVHDEILSEHPIDIASECAFEVARIMKDTAQEYLPDVTALQVEPALMVRWTKSAESEFDAQGRVLPIGQCPKCQKWGPVDANWNMLVGKASHNGDCTWRGEMLREDVEYLLDIE